MLKDLFYQYAALNGVPADVLPAGSIQFLRDEMDAPVFPKFGLRSVALSLRKFIEKHKHAKVMTGVKVNNLLFKNEERLEVVGVITENGALYADYVVSTLTLTQTQMLVGNSEDPGVETPKAGIAAILVELSSTAFLVPNVHTFSFLTPQIDLQERTINKGVMPEHFSFDMIVADNLDGLSKRPGDRSSVTIFLNVPFSYSDKAGLLAKVFAKIETYFPAFKDAVTFHEVVLPGEYSSFTGWSGITNEIARNIASYDIKGPIGFYRTKLPAPHMITNSYTALSSGFDCAEKIVGGMKCE
jgi:phytoene dehydrogenase-like protein